MTRSSLPARQCLYAFYVALLLLWCRSFFVRDEVSLNLLGRLCLVNSFNNHLHFHYFIAPYNGPLIHLGLNQPQIKLHGRYLQLLAGADSTGWWLALPYWLPALLLSAYPIWLARSRRIRRRRHEQGLCLSCGYDLRQSTSRCPECGADIKGSR